MEEPRAGRARRSVGMRALGQPIHMAVEATPKSMWIRPTSFGRLKYGMCATVPTAKVKGKGGSHAPDDAAVRERGYPPRANSGIKAAPSTPPARAATSTTRMSRRRNEHDTELNAENGPMRPDQSVDLRDLLNPESGRGVGTPRRRRPSAAWPRRCRSSPRWCGPPPRADRPPTSTATRSQARAMSALKALSRSGRLRVRVARPSSTDSRIGSLTGSPPRTPRARGAFPRSRSGGHGAGPARGRRAPSRPLARSRSAPCRGSVRRSSPPRRAR